MKLSMDKKAKKRIEVLRKKITQLQQQLAGAKQQMDDPEEVRQYEAQIATAQEEIDKLKAASSIRHHAAASVGGAAPVGV